MYAIIVYDVAVERVVKVCQFLRRYLNWMQNSVFEGELTESELKRIKLKLKELMNPDNDSVIIYILQTEKVVKKEYIGVRKAEPSFII